MFPAILRERFVMRDVLLMRIDLAGANIAPGGDLHPNGAFDGIGKSLREGFHDLGTCELGRQERPEERDGGHGIGQGGRIGGFRSEENTSELQSLMSNSYAVFRVKKKN